MREIIALAVISLSILLGMGSCSKTQVNEAKLTLAEKAGDAAEKVLVKEYNKFPELNNDICKEEASDIGKSIEGKVADLLKAEKEKQVGQKSFAGDAAKLACKGIMSKALPMVFDEYMSTQPCAAKALGYSTSKLADSVCDKIKF